MIRESEASAGKLLAKEGSDAERVKEGYLRFFGRPPSEKESKAALNFLERYEKSLSGAAASKHKTAWSALCQAWFGLCRRGVPVHRLKHNRPQAAACTPTAASPRTHLQPHGFRETFGQHGWHGQETVPQQTRRR